MNTKKLPIGISDFKKMVTGDYYYVDKTLFIQEILDRGDSIILIPRPRRFGKTLNLSMLQYYFDCCPEDFVSNSDEPHQEPSQPSENLQNDYKQLFNNMDIGQAGDEYLKHMGKYPVIFLTFRQVKETDWESCWKKIKLLIQEEYRRHKYLLNSSAIDEWEKKYFKRILDLEGDKSDFENSLEKLLIFLSRFYARRAIILIDEYDAPVHAGFTYGYYEAIISFIRNFLCGGLKDTDKYLEKGVLTGIMRIAKESIFSGLNNIGVYTLLDEEFDRFFGFTETEIQTILNDFDLMDMYDQVQLWYNGYRFGSKIIYNPWSIINFLASNKKSLKPYWINTSDNAIVDTLLSRGGKELKKEMELLIQGESIIKPINENIILKDITIVEDSLWSFLLLGGYLKQTVQRRDSFTDKTYYSLSIPNREVKTIYTQIVSRYFESKVENEKLEIMLKALINADIPLFEKLLKQIVLEIFSYHDFGNEPERVYHALVAGLLVWISDTHEIKSNRESGYGRYDIMIIPRDPSLTGYVIEFKTVDATENETVDAALKAAIKQMKDKKYMMELEQRGIQRIKQLAIAFSGKDVTIKESSPKRSKLRNQDVKKLA